MERVRERERDRESIDRDRVRRGPLERDLYRVCGCAVVPVVARGREGEMDRGERERARGERERLAHELLVEYRLPRGSGSG